MAQLIEKALVRVHRARSLTGAPIYLLADPAIPAAEVPATTPFTRALVSDHSILQREAKGSAAGLTASAYAIVLAIALGCSR